MLGSRSFAYLDASPRVDAWDWVLQSWIRSLGCEFTDYWIAHTLPQGGREPRNLTREITIGTVCAGRIIPKSASKTFNLAYNEEYFDVCLVIGRARATCTIPGGHIDVQPYHAFTVWSPDGPPMPMTFHDKGVFLKMRLHTGSVVKDDPSQA